MREIVSQTRHAGLTLAALAALGFVSEATASSPSPPAPALARLATPRSVTSASPVQTWELAYQQRRGRTMVPQKPVNIDSSPMIDILNKALKALNATDRDYDGHREKAINHVETAIHKLQVPGASAKGKGNGSNPKGDNGKDSAKTETDNAPAKTPTTPQDESDASMRKAKAALFEAHHKLTDKASTAGRIHADADVRIAIDEVTLALKTSTATATPAATSAPTRKPAVK
jgi:hypothetical protein